MSKENLKNGSNVVKLPITTLMHASLETNDVMFNKPFESVKDVQDFIVWLVRNGAMDSSIKWLDWSSLTQEQCVWKDHFILSQESIKLCFDALKKFKPDAKVLFVEWTEAQVSLILNKKTA